jgi:hypothetical protein
MRLASHKLPIDVKFVIRGSESGAGEFDEEPVGVVAEAVAIELIAEAAVVEPVAVAETPDSEPEIVTEDVAPEAAETEGDNA